MTMKPGIPSRPGTLRLLSALTAILTVMGPAVASADDYHDTIAVEVGRTQVVETPDVERVALGTRGLVDVRAFPRIGQILLIGKRAGASDLRVWDTEGNDVRYRLRVEGRAGDERETVSASELNKLFGDVSGVRVVALSENRVAITGQAKRQIDYDRAESLAQQFSEVINQVKEPSLTLEATVLIEARILEVSRNEMDRVGINWDNTFSGPIFAWLNDWDTNSVFRPELPADLELTGGASALPADVGSNDFAGWAGSWQSVINLMRQSGVARLLAEPRLTTVTGQEASFHSGGEIPVQTIDGDGNVGIEYKDFGISLNIKPETEASGLIRTEVGVEVSAIDNSISINGQPGLTTRNTDTVMNAREGQSMVISGLLSRQEGKDVEAVPGISRIPILGELFKSRSFRDQRTELVIIVTPYLVTAESPRMQRLKAEGRTMVDEADADLEFGIFD
ncbi:MAG: pilus assembly protein N-terminal domain-containing protein [Halofilum sp. (in: g-proteobacteria)]|nr:pilus assembly protein N-terminal domain-containing protein [Halofilum sp. (in: g-proteobacteria)]